jgi:hypothetical protein
MSTSTALSFVSHDQLFGRSLSLETLRGQAPAVFASSADGERSARYTFIPSVRVLEGLVEAGCAYRVRHQWIDRLPWCVPDGARGPPGECRR